MKKILVIEDQREVRENICEILELTGYDVFSAENGKKGCEKAVEWQPDLILCDVMMPELDGFGVLKVLRKRKDTQTIPLIFLTAKVELDDLRKGMGLGADDYLMKPFDDTDLLEAIDLRLKKRESEIQRSLQYKSELGNLQSEERQRQTLDLLQRAGNDLVINEGDTVWSKGQEPRGIYLLKSGTLKEFRRHESGKIFMVRYIRPDTYFGVRSFFAQHPYETWTEVDQAGEAVFIPADTVTQYMFEERDIALFFLQQTIHFSNTLEKRAIDYAYSSVRRRVAGALLELLGQGNQNGKQVSREDLASWAGTAKETTIRMLSDFKSEGSIAIEGREITILNPEALEKVRL